MIVELDARIRESAQRLADLNRQKAELSQARDELGRLEYQLGGLEAAVAETQEQIESLDAFSLQGLVLSVLGSKERRRQECQEDLGRLQAKRDEQLRVVDEAAERVRAGEAAVARLPEAEKEHQALCDEQRRIILEAGDERAARLRDLLAEIEAAKAARQQTRKVLQAGKHLIERVSTMHMSVGRANNRMLHGGSLGALGNLAVHATARYITSGPVDRVRAGLEELAESVMALNLAGDTDRDREVIRLGTVMMEFAVQVAGGWPGDAAGLVRSISDQVHHLLGLIESIHDEVERHLTDAERDCQALLEAA